MPFVGFCLFYPENDTTIHVASAGSTETPAPTPASTEEEVCMAGVPGILYKGEVCCPISCGSCAGTPRLDDTHCRPLRSVADHLPRSLQPTLQALRNRSKPAYDGRASRKLRFSHFGAGNGCSGRDGGDDFTGHDACCKSGVEDLGRVCSATVGAPCIVSDGENILPPYTLAR